MQSVSDLAPLLIFMLLNISALKYDTGGAPLLQCHTSECRIVFATSVYSNRIHFVARIACYFGELNHFNLSHSIVQHEFHETVVSMPL